MYVHSSGGLWLICSGFRYRTLFSKHIRFTPKTRIRIASSSLGVATSSCACVHNPVLSLTIHSLLISRTRFEIFSFLFSPATSTPSTTMQLYFANVPRFQVRCTVEIPSWFLIRKFVRFRPSPLGSLICVGSILLLTYPRYSVPSILTQANNSNNPGQY